MNRTFAIIKPDAVAAGKSGAILHEIEKAGFRIIALRMTRLSREEAAGFYAVHSERPFFNGLLDFMTEGPVVLMGLEAPDAIRAWRDLMGATNPDSRRRHHPQTLRHQYRTQRNPRLLCPGNRCLRIELLLPRLRTAVEASPFARTGHSSRKLSEASVAMSECGNLVDAGPPAAPGT